MPVILRTVIVMPDFFRSGIRRASGGRAAHRELEHVECVNVVAALFQQTLDKLFPFLTRAQVLRAQCISTAVPLTQKM